MEYSKEDVKDLIDVVTSGANGLAVEITTGRKMIWTSTAGVFIGRQCIDCRRVIQTPKLSKNSSHSTGFNVVCKPCKAARTNKFRLDNPNHYPNKRKEVPETIKSIIRSHRGNVRNRYGVEIGEPTPQQFESLQKRLQQALEYGICVYTGEALTRDNLSSDHITPVTRRNSEAYRIFGDWDSIMFVSGSGNSRKGVKSLIEYMEQIDADCTDEIERRLKSQYPELSIKEIYAALDLDDSAYQSTKKQLA